MSFDELEGAEWRAFGALSEDPDLYGLLFPSPDSALPAKAMSRDAALLFHALREPAHVPRLLGSLFGTEAEAQVRQLVVDGVFEVECDGRYLSGESALQPEGSRSDERGPYVARLSRDAIAYGARLSNLSIRDVAARLYMYNRIPSTPAVQRRFLDTAATVAYLVGDSVLAKRLDSQWISEVTEGAWLTWRSPQGGAALEYKLYVSPTLDALPDAFALTVDALAHTRCIRFKVGLTAYGLLRPDKLVAYFSTLEGVQQAAELILASAAGIPAHGVPFSAAIDADGLVSWGMDPPRLGPQSLRSWRQWVAERIAVYIAAATETAARDTTDFVLRRLALDGVDTTTWTPDFTIWRGLGALPNEVA
ncbi:MAG: hypothetical protein ACXVII_37645 [Solirubrobacteraceae bacterium]